MGLLRIIGRPNYVKHTPHAVTWYTGKTLPLLIRSFAQNNTPHHHNLKKKLFEVFLQILYETNGKYISINKKYFPN